MAGNLAPYKTILIGEWLKAGGGWNFGIGNMLICAATFMHSANSVIRVTPIIHCVGWHVSHCQLYSTVCC